jgi:hypothetical protein
MKKSKYKNVELERIPCPIDPSHSIYKHNLPLHSKICNVKTRQLEMKEEAFYCLDCNSGLISTENSQNSLHLTEIKNNGNNLEKSKTAANSEIYDEESFSSFIDPDSLLRKIKQCFRKINENGDLSLVPNIFEEKNKYKKIDIISNENGNGIMFDITTVPLNTNTNTNTPSLPVPTHPEDPKSIEGCPYLSEESYVLLESRVLNAVSGTQVAFERVRHARQDARIVR